MRRFERSVLVIILATMLIKMAIPFLRGQLVSGHDVWFYPPRLGEFHENLRHGLLLPQWAPDLESGNGQPFFVFTPPFLYYLAEPFFAAGAHAATAFNLVVLLVLIASTASMFLLCRLLFGERAGWVGAVAYVSSPYFHVDLYVRHALAESLSFALLPAAIYGFAAYARKGKAGFLVLAAISYAGILLSHNPSALILTPVVFSFIFFDALQFGSLRLFGKQLSTLLLGIGVAAFFWLPSLVERTAVHIERTTNDYFTYSNHFVYPRQFLSRFWGYGLSGPGPYDGMSFSLGRTHVWIAGLALILAGLGLLIARRRIRPEQIFLAAWTFALCFLMTPYAAAIWQWVPLLQAAQFPWRLLGPAAFCIAGLAGSFVEVLPRWSILRATIAPIAVLALVIPNWRHSKPEYYVTVGADMTDPDEIARKGFDASLITEFEPRWVQKNPGYDPHRLRVLEGESSVEMVHATPELWSASIVLKTPSLFETRLFYFPGWEVRLDERAIPIEIAEPSGRIRFRIEEPGVHSVRIELRSTWVRLFGEIISFGSVIAGIVALARRARN